MFGYAARTPRDAFPDMDTAEVTAAVRCSSRAAGTFSSTCLAGSHRVGLHLHGDGIALEVSEKELRVDVGQGSTVLTATRDPFEREDRAFVDAVQGRPDRTRTTYAEALRTHRVTVGVLRSAAEGGPVPITNEETDV